MNIICVLAVLLPSATIGGDLRIKINVDGDPKDARVSFSGQDISPITDAERERFGLTDIKLLKMVEKLHNGKRPDGVRVRPQGEHGNLFRIYNWPPMMRVLKPISARVTKYEKKPTSSIAATYDNPGEENVTQALTMEKEFSSEIANSWNSEKSLGVGVSVSVDFGYGSAGMNVDYSYTWGSAETISKVGAVTMSSGAEMEFLPKESAVMNINFTVNYIHLEVKYLAHWQGSAAFNYESQYDNHYFYHYYLDDFQKVNKDLQEYITVTQRSVIEYCSEIILTVTSTGGPKKKKGKKNKE
nr:venom protein U-MPTX.8-31 [Megalopyge opercularis]